MKKLISIIATLLFFASVTVFTLPMMQDDGNADLSLTEKVSIMANAGDGGDGDEDEDADITCTQDPGPGAQCWTYNDNYSPPCEWTGYQYDFCIAN